MFRHLYWLLAKAVVILASSTNSWAQCLPLRFHSKINQNFATRSLILHGQGSSWTIISTLSSSKTSSLEALLPSLIRLQSAFRHTKKNRFNSILPLQVSSLQGQPEARATINILITYRNSTVLISKTSSAINSNVISIPSLTRRWEEGSSQQAGTLWASTGHHPRIIPLTVENYFSLDLI